MARTYTKKSKMNAINDFSGLLSLEEMEFFPNLDLCLPLYDDGTNDDVFQIVAKDNEDFSTGEILQELDLQGGTELLEPDWFTEKFDLSSFEPSNLTETNTTLEGLTQLENSLCGNTFPDLNDELLIPLPEENITIPAEMPSTPEQKVPEFHALSPYSTSSEGSSGVYESSPSSPCSNYSDNSNDSTVSLKELLTSSDSKCKDTKTHAKSVSHKRPAPFTGPTGNLQPPKRVKTPAQKQRKRVQNKDAATRYRVKKRSEQELLYEEAEKAEKENKELKDQVASISKEIEYLKNLMIEVYKTKQRQQKAN
ncbi:cyclic AMP-dependent transcription factor ATF-4 [Exaiptasia diaphana]|uniref:BZIP domain-containing protein n=1 Tax=Exaiptasia diaphana TaxID=2652724 RepID=A0A913XA00_EXADI|nr:cyclic AMP-dependent transcription factor ATF-4 [Exaiptasia diaphana]KXJ26573.1 Cyclic AMP-dependent transcription factor ATF-5 [Exaiptasia diaphana]